MYFLVNSSLMIQLFVSFLFWQLSCCNCCITFFPMCVFVPVLSKVLSPCSGADPGFLERGFICGSYV